MNLGSATSFAENVIRTVKTEIRGKQLVMVFKIKGIIYKLTQVCICQIFTQIYIQFTAGQAGAPGPFWLCIGGNSQI